MCPLYSIHYPIRLLRIHITPLVIFKPYGAVTYKRIKVTDAKQTEKMQKCLSGEGSRRGSHKERICAEQVTDKERSTDVNVTDVYM